MHHNKHLRISLLDSVIGQVTPKDKLEGPELIIFAERKLKLAAARKKRGLAHS
jgi:hypothetical protein